MRWVKMRTAQHQPEDKPQDRLVVGHQDCGTCGEQMICTPLEGDKLGHRDMAQTGGSGPCYVFIPSGGVGKVDDFYVAEKNTATNLTWTTFSKGGVPPTNAYRIGGLYLGRTHETKDGCGDGKNVMPGWISLDTDTGAFDRMLYEDCGSKSVEDFEVATCQAPSKDAFAFNQSTGFCTEVPVGTSGSFPTQQECQEHLPPTPPPTPWPAGLDCDMYDRGGCGECVRHDQNWHGCCWCDTDLGCHAYGSPYNPCSCQTTCTPSRANASAPSS